MTPTGNLAPSVVLPSTSFPWPWSEAGRVRAWPRVVLPARALLALKTSTGMGTNSAALWGGAITLKPPFESPPTRLYRNLYIGIPTYMYLIHMFQHHSRRGVKGLSGLSNLHRHGAGRLEDVNPGAISGLEFCRCETE